MDAMSITDDFYIHFRNGILYYGTRLDEEYAKKVVEFTKKIYPKLKTKCDKW